MLVSPIKKTQDVTLKVVADRIKQQLANNQLYAIDNATTLDKVVSKPVLAAVKTLEDKFTITFSYRQQLHRTKVNLSGTKYGTPIYKVALSSRLSNPSRICWLQNTPDGWVTSLGDSLDSKLIGAITSAIEDQQ